jgi:hypothetical protein
MALERDFELLDDYVANRLSGADKSAFEQRLEADPDLQRELNLQQKVVESIRQARIAELKNLLNNVPVPAPVGGEISAGTSAVVAVVITALVGIGIYLVLNQPEKASTPNQTSTQNIAQDSVNPEDVPQQADLNSTQAPAVNQPEVTEQATAEKTEKKTTPTVLPKQESKVPKQKDSISKSPIDVFDPTEDTVAKAKTEVEDDAPAKSSSTKSSLSIKTDAKNKKYKFHYQFKNGELYLYGPFDKNLIEIMEFIGENKQAIFMYHESKFYYLNDKTEKIKPLTAVNDPALLKKLKASRGN